MELLESNCYDPGMSFLPDNWVWLQSPLGHTHVHQTDNHLWKQIYRGEVLLSFIARSEAIICTWYENSLNEVDAVFATQTSAFKKYNKLKLPEYVQRKCY